MMGLSIGSPVCEEPKQFCSWAPAYIVVKYYVSGIEVSLRSDPDIISYFCNTVKASLYISVGADENTIPDLERLQMLKANTGADLQHVTDSASDSPPNCPPHQAVQLAIAMRKPGVVFEQGA